MLSKRTLLALVPFLALASADWDSSSSPSPTAAASSTGWGDSTTSSPTVTSTSSISKISIPPPAECKSTTSAWCDDADSCTTTVTYPTGCGSIISTTSSASSCTLDVCTSPASNPHAGPTTWATSVIASPASESTEYWSSSSSAEYATSYAVTGTPVSASVYSSYAEASATTSGSASTFTGGAAQYGFPGMAVAAAGLAFVL